MKTLVIERPDFLKNITHDISWTLSDGNGAKFDIAALSRENLAEIAALSTRIGGGATAISNYILALQRLEGVLMMVPTNVSRDLEISTVAGSLANLSWPAGSIEMRFADPGLPAVLLCAEASTPNQEPSVALACTAKDESILTLAMPESMWAGYVAGQIEPSMEFYTTADKAMDKGEAAAMRYMAMLAIKVIAYSSVPGHAPVELKTKAERKAAGIHPKHAYTKKTVVVRYLPRILRDQPPTGEVAGESHRRFLGRAGHVRFYHSDYYKNVKGQWRWMPPIPPPEGVQVIYKIRKIYPNEKQN